MPARRSLLAIAALLGSLLASTLPASPAADAAGDRPNVLVILTDDQRPTDTMHVMPETLQRFGAEGTHFPNAVATTPLCCPARAGVLTGQFAHNNGVRTNGDVEELGDHGGTLQRHLDDAGYQTALVGKFLNQWKVEDDPPHWDRWSMMQPGPDYFETEWNVDGSQQTVTDYATDFTADRATAYLDEFNLPVNDEDPWFLYVSPYAPHAPYQPAPEYANADVGVWPGNPAVFEKDKRDKPKWVRARKRTLAQGQAVRDGQLRMLMSVDDLVEDVFDRLEALGEADDTIALFLSDNGFLWSDHGLGGKKEAYLPSIRVPFFLRWPGMVPAGATDPRLVANIDVLPTVLDAAGVPHGAADGMSLLRPRARTKILTELWNKQHRGGWASILTPRYQYIERYKNDNLTVKFRELYRIDRDPWQLRNLLGDGRKKNDSDGRGLARELRKARRCGGSGRTSCAAVLTVPVTLCAGREAFRGDHRPGTEGRNVLRGGRGRSLLCGAGGRDVLRGRGGNDLLLGGPGNDLLIGGKGKDRCVGGPGRDRARGCERGKA